MMLPPLPRRLVRGAIYPAYRRLRHDDVTEKVKELEANQWLSRADLQEMRWKRLVALLERVAAVPYYRDLFKSAGLAAADIRTPRDFAKIPLLTKQDIRSAGKAILSEDPSRKGCPTSTGGSTGEPLFFYTDLAASELRLAAGVFAYRWVGSDVGDRIAHIWAPHHDISRRRRIAFLIKDYFYNRITLSSFDMSEANMGRYARTLKKFRPDVLVGYPSALSLFAEFCRSHSVTGVRPRIAVASGEKMHQHQREIIEQSFACPVFDRYGSNEFSVTAQECEQHNGLHLLNDYLHVEVVHESGRLAGTGEIGEIVVTDLANYYMPFIRYRTGDLAVATERLCPCGRGSPLLDRIEGRTFSVIVSPEGRAAGGFFWTHLSRQVPGIKQFQVEQRDPGGVIFRIVRAPEWKDEYRSDLEKKIKAGLGEGFAVEFEMVDSIPLTRTGKFNFIISRIEGKGCGTRPHA